MDNYLSEALDERYADWRAVVMFPESNNSVIDLLLSDYMSKYKDKAPAQLDAAFKNCAVPQFRIMFFVGHDSSAATICSVFYLLSQNPSATKKLRAKHDEVFGTDTSTASYHMRTQPQFLNKFPYTAAVIKEVLRLFPPASGFSGEVSRSLLPLTSSLFPAPMSSSFSPRSVSAIEKERPVCRMGPVGWAAGSFGKFSLLGATACASVFMAGCTGTLLNTVVFDAVV
jgi:cytochrome P450